MEHKFVCPGCQHHAKTTVPKHDAPYRWSCECGWSMTIQTDQYGLSIGWNKPLPKKPELRIVK